MMGDVKKRVVAWCAEQGLPVPRFRSDTRDPSDRRFEVVIGDKGMLIPYPSLDLQDPVNADAIVHNARVRDAYWQSDFKPKLLDVFGEGGAT